MFFNIKNALKNFIINFCSFFIAPPTRGERRNNQNANLNDGNEQREGPEESAEPEESDEPHERECEIYDSEDDDDYYDNDN